ncbi:ADP-ribosyltransferase [Xanthomonas theicola]|nr:ADP-ribosyltransferase [Xanthomonas theicola]QNH25650.1 hypothetical protein G4Q83_14055 [Xanthomonas theicola]
MPVSPSQHRTSIGNYNHSDEKARATIIRPAPGTGSIDQASADGSRHFTSQITRVANSDEILNRSSNQRAGSRRGAFSTAVLSVLLFNQIRAAGTAPFSATETFLSDTGNNHPLPNSDYLATIGASAAAALNRSNLSSVEYGYSSLPPEAYANQAPRGNASVTQGNNGDIYVVTETQKKNELISAVVRHLLSSGQLIADDSKDVEAWLRSEAAGKPLVISRLRDSDGINRTRRALAAENDPRTSEHIKRHCAFEEEVLNARGENEGKLLIFQAQRAENPFRMIYNDTTEGGPSPLTRGITDGLNIVTDFLTLGIKPLIGKLIANAKRREYYKNQGDRICAERFKRLFIAELATSIDVDGLAFTRHATPRLVKSAELLDAVPARERAAFFTRDPSTGIRKEILLELKPGISEINDGKRKIYLKPTERPNEFITHHPDALKPELLEKKVIIDETKHVWRYADEFDIANLNVQVNEGKRQINLNGNYYNLNKNAAGKFEIVVRKKSGIKEYIPVYMEPRSKTWHLNVHNNHPVFSEPQLKIIEKIAIPEDQINICYIVDNNNAKYYGHGKILISQRNDATPEALAGNFIEIAGAFAPVRNTQHQGSGALYEVYSIKNPDKKGYPIEWDGTRWRFERSTSVHVSRDLRKRVTDSMLDKNVDARTLSAPDSRGLRFDANGNGFIKIKRDYAEIKKNPNGMFSLASKTGPRLILRYRNGQFHIETTAELLKRIMTTGLGGTGSRTAARHYKNQKTNVDIDPALTVDERQTLHAYGRQYHSDINEYMRAGKPESYYSGSPHLTEPLINAEKNMQSALRKIPPYAGKVYRGAELKKDLYQKLEKGDIVSDRGFMSTSTSFDVAKLHRADGRNTHVPVLYEITVVKSGHPISRYTNKPRENEVLIEDNTFFKVLEKNDGTIKLMEIDASSLSQEQRDSVIYIST